MNPTAPLLRTELRLYHTAALHYDVELEETKAINRANHSDSSDVRKRAINKLRAIYYWKESHK